MITVHSEGNKKYVENIIKQKDKVRVVPNCVNTDELHPGDRNNEFSSKYKLNDKFVVSFAGVLGYLQDFNVILRSAKELERYEDIIFIIVGDGILKDSIVERIKKENIKNVRMLPMQPKDKYPLVLHSSDVSLVTLVKDLKTPVVPSKLLSIMSCARPVLATIQSSDAREIIEESKAAFCFDVGDYKGLIETILFFYKNREKIEEYGLNGRRYVLENYSVKKCAEIYKKLFQEIK